MIQKSSKNLVFAAIVFIILVLLLGYTGCNENDGSGVITSTGDNLSVGFYSENAQGDNTLILDEAKFLVKEMKLQRHGDGGDCNVKTGPFVVYLDMNQKVVLTAMATIPVGDYEKVKFKIHKPRPNEEITDPDFIESTSRRFSVVAKGSFNGNSFVYKSDITVVKEIEFEQHPVTVAEAVAVNITIRLNPYEWFMQNGLIIDPLYEGNRHIIDHNIKQSLRRAFRDMDHNGEPD
jgi:hypothetical protein